MIIMAIDYGDVRTGISLCDKEELVAYPYTVIKETKYLKLLNNIIDIVDEKNVEAIVVGYPKNMDGTLGERAEKSERIYNFLKRKLKIPIFLFDERLSTVYAHRILSEANIKMKKQKNIVDSVASCIILDSFLEYRKHQ